MDALIRCAFLEADENGSRGYLKFTMDGQTSVMASFDRRDQADFQAAYQAVNRRMHALTAISLAMREPVWRNASS